MIEAPLPIYKGLFAALSSGQRYYVWFLKHNPDAGETEKDDCFITVSRTLAGGEKNCGQSGLWPVSEFRAQFKFLSLEDPAKPFIAGA